MVRTFMIRAACAAVLAVSPTAFAEGQFGTADEAKAMLLKAAAGVKSDKTKTLDLINKGEGGFLESVRRDYAGLHSFLSMSLIEARRRKASALRLRFSQSLARRLQRPSHANVRSTTHRFGRTTNAFA
jgi:hypothetical protein